MPGQGTGTMPLRASRVDRTKRESNMRFGIGCLIVVLGAFIQQVAPLVCPRACAIQCRGLT